DPLDALLAGHVRGPGEDRPGHAVPGVDRQLAPDPVLVDAVGGEDDDRVDHPGHVLMAGRVDRRLGLASTHGPQQGPGWVPAMPLKLSELVKVRRSLELRV